MKILLFEWMVGGGLIDTDCPFDQEDSFFQQGRAMFSAFVDDLISAGHQVVAPLDARVCQSDQAASWTQKTEHFDPRPIRSDLRQTLRKLALEVEEIILIAPECDGVLTECYRGLEAFNDKWFGGPLNWIELASNKNRMQEYLKANGIAVPPDAGAAGECWVAKPAQGAGSDDVQVFTGTDRFDEFKDRKEWRLEQYVPGKSVSVSIVETGGNRCFLPPTGQIFEASPGPAIGTYSGAEYPLNENQTQRAMALARQTVEVLPEFRGYIGIDMILADTGPDVVIEINPRMTMSYCHLPLELRGKWLEAPRR